MIARVPTAVERESEVAGYGPPCTIDGQTSTPVENPLKVFPETTFDPFETVMPAGLDQQLSKQDLSDLIAFLKACK